MRTETKKTSRRYRKRRRAELEAATRERITEAAVKLHRTVGPAAANWSAIAGEAGVQRATVYRHFPDMGELFEACTAHFYARNPLPDPSRWEAIADPDERLRTALQDLYEWFARTEEMLTNVTRDAAHVPPHIRARFLSYFDAARETLMRGQPAHGRARERTAAAVGHTMAFGTWRSLTREQGLEDDEAVALMARLVDSARRSAGAL